MTDFLHFLVRGIILARARERTIARGKEVLKKLPEKIPLGTRFHYAIPPPRGFPVRAQVPVPVVPVPTRDVIPVPKPGEPEPAQIPFPIPIQQAPPQTRPQQPVGVSEEYTKIILPEPGVVVPSPGEASTTEMEMLAGAGEEELPVTKIAPKIPYKIRRPARLRPAVRPMERARAGVTRPVQKARTGVTRPMQAKAIAVKVPAITKTKPTEKPAKTSKTDLGVITGLIKDPYVKAVEYDGGKLKVITAEGEKDQGSLSEEEAKSIVESFAKAAGVKMQPAFEVTYGKLKMSAVISEILGTRFSIEKV